MKRISAGLLFTIIAIHSCAQQTKQDKKPVTENTLLWKISGKGLEKPSYLYGTIHMLCKDDAGLSSNMKDIIKQSDEVYFEVDLDNIIEMFSVMSKMKMKGDTTLHDLLSADDYKKVKEYFETKGSMLPFSALETYKPILAASLIGQNSLPCDNTAMMEQVIMSEAKNYNKKIKGLETMSYQAEVLDGIPYKKQAEQLVTYIDHTKTGNPDDEEMNQMMDAYRNQDLGKLEQLMMKGEAGISDYADILLFKRNRNWVEKLKSILPGKSIVIAVGAGHLPGTNGVINLLKKEGYTVTPVENSMSGTREL